MSVLINPYKHDTPDLDKLWVVTTIFNPMRYWSRYDLYWKFKKHMERAGANLVTVELAFGDRPYEVTKADDPHAVQLRTNQEFWLKEAALNAGIARLPPDWKYVMWCDADVEFHRHDFLEETIHQLQHAAVVQCFEDAVDLGPRGEVMELHKGFVWSWMYEDKALRAIGGRLKKGQKLGAGAPYYGDGGELEKVGRRTHTSVYHPGYAWAARREAFVDLGGLLDMAILGAADHHMAWALVGEVLEHSPSKLSPAYKRYLTEWQTRALTHVRKNIGYVPGTLFHHFHGAKKNRKYGERWDVIHKHGFDPDTDLKKDWHGLYTLSDKGLRMRNDIRRYLLERNEDSVDT